MPLRAAAQLTDETSSIARASSAPLCGMDRRKRIGSPGRGHHLWPVVFAHALRSASGIDGPSFAELGRQMPSISGGL